VSRRTMSWAALTAAGLALGAPAATSAAKAVPKPPAARVTAATGAATHVLLTSALLTGSIHASVEGKSLAVSYYFRWGPTSALAFQTPVLVDPKPSERIHVGQAISGLTAATTYHYRLFIVGPEGITVAKAERTFKTKSIKQRFLIPRVLHATYGVPAILSGSMTGSNSAGQSLQLQASPFPYLEAFAPVGRPAVTNAAGAFSFRLGNLLASTQLRLVTLGTLPAYSPTVTVEVQPKVTLHVRASTQTGLVRLYGTVMPAVHGAKILLQVQKAVRPGRREITSRYVTQFSTNVKRGLGNSSRFSIIVRVNKGGRYRAYLQLGKKGALFPGPSTRTYVLHAAPALKKR
jgi:hypothetical protein